MADKVNECQARPVIIAATWFTVSSQENTQRKKRDLLDEGWPGKSTRFDRRSIEDVLRRPSFADTKVVTRAGNRAGRTAAASVGPKKLAIDAAEDDDGRLNSAHRLRPVAYRKRLAVERF